MRVLVAVQIENISTEDGGRSVPVVAGSDRGDLGLVFLEADLHVSVALVPGAVQVLGGPGPVAALPVEQLAVYIPHRVKLQLEIARGPGHLKIKNQRGDGHVTTAAGGSGGALPTVPPSNFCQLHGTRVYIYTYIY